MDKSFRNFSKKCFCVCGRCRQFSKYYSFGFGVPKGGWTANWVGESPDYIPYKHETNRNTFDDRTNDSVAITGGGRGRGAEGVKGRGGARWLHDGTV